MGGTITVTPTATHKNTGWAVTGGSAHAALADSDNATFVMDSAPGSSDTLLELGFADPALPDGSAIKSTVLVVRALQAAGNQGTKARIYKRDGFGYASPWRKFFPTDADTADIRVVAAPAVGSSKSTAAGNALRVQLMQGQGGATAGDIKVRKLWLEVNYVDAPVATDLVLEPSDGHQTTSRPPVTWDILSQDDIRQYEFRAAVWRDSDYAAHGGEAAVEADAELLFGASAWDRTAGWVQSASQTWAPTRDLIGNVAYTYYVQLTGLYAGERIRKVSAKAELGIVMDLTPPAAPSAVTAAWSSGDYRTEGTVTFAAGVPAGYDAKRVHVERQVQGSGAWWPVPGGSINVGTAATTCDFVDTFAKSGEVLEYRAKVEAYSSDTQLGLASDYTAAAGSVEPSYDRFLLRDPLELTAGAPLHARLLGDLESKSTEVQGEFRPLGAEYPVIVSDVVTGERWNVEVLLPDQAASDAFDALRASRRTLVLQTDMTGDQRWVRLGPDVGRTLIRQVGRTAEATRSRTVAAELIESRAPVGQPQAY